jgi:acetyltransferase
LRVLTRRPLGLRAVFEPRRVALVGASEQPGRTGELLWRNLADFRGEVVPVTASAATIGGRRAFPTLGSVDGDIDLAVIAVPAARVPGVLRDAAAKEVPAAVVISGGFAETGGDGRRLQDELVAAARAGGVRVIGPNCFGVQNPELRLNASLAAGRSPAGGGIGLVTQSGAYGMAIHALAGDEQVGFAKLCALGNKADVGDADLLAFLGADPATRTLCFFVESLPDGRAFFEAACAVTPHKPVILAKTGRSPAGRRAAQSHTAGLAGQERAWRAALQHAGVLLARSGLEMLDAARALDQQPVPAGSRVAVITNSGGTGVELADLLADEGLEVPELSAGLQAELGRLLPGFASPRNPVDMTPVWSRFAELYPALVDRLARSGEVDSVVPVLLHRSAADEQVAMGIRDAVARLRRDGCRVPVYVCWVAPRSSRPNADLLQAAGVPCFDWPERTARAVAHATRYGAARDRVRRPPAPPRRTCAALPPGWLDSAAAARVLAGAGIPHTAGRVCATPAEAEAAAAEIGYPVVVKALHDDLLHKARAGGVRLGLTDAAGVRRSGHELLALAPGATLLVQPRLTGIEMLVGGFRDAQFGPFVVLGTGGVLVDVIDDAAIAPAPLDRSDADRLVDRLRGRGLLDGADRGALVGVARAVGDLLASVPEIAELDLNPVFVSAEGAVAVDWRIRVSNSPSQDENAADDSPCHAGERASTSP